MRPCVFVRTLGIAFLLAAAALLFGGTSTGTISPRVAQAQSVSVSVGQVSGSDAFIGIVIDGSAVTAYVCDGNESDVSVWGWFFGQLNDGQAELVSTNGVALLLDATGDTPQGEVVTRSGDHLAFQTEAAVGDAGLWRGQGLVNGSPVLGGWVLLNDGEQRGATSIQGTARGAPMLNPRAPTVSVNNGLLVVIAIIAILIG